MALRATDRTLPMLETVPFRLPVPDTTAMDRAFVREASRASRCLPGPVYDALVDFVDDPGPAGALLLRAMPIGAVPVTPARPGAPTGKDLDSEFTLLTVARRLGEPIGYLQEHGGELVQNIVPSLGDEGRQLSTSSSVTLEWHTETAFHPHKPRYLLLLCLRGDDRARTMLCSIADVMPQLDDATVAVLREPRFRTRPDASFLDDGTIGELGPPMAIIGGTDDDPVFTYDEDLMVGIDADAQAALDRLTAVVHERATEVVLEAGDLLVVDNHRVVHGRSPFRARFDGSDRWLQRAFVVSDLGASAAERSGRIVTTRFGATP